MVAFVNDTVAVDPVLLDREHRVRAAVEPDNRSYRRQERCTRDRRLNPAFAAGRLLLAGITPGPGSVEQAVRQLASRAVAQAGAN